jgi:MoCo/4Fe-4S cofactor protein with predicted Tat translocation signal
MSGNNKRIDRQYWRSLEQTEGAPESEEQLQREFPVGAAELASRVSRRGFLTIMGATAALAGVAGCRKPLEKIIPYVVQPEEVIPGIAQHYATTLPFGNDAYGLLVECHEGRPTKIEGNPRHPSSLGGTNRFLQAAILDLYDPDRSRRVFKDGADSSWDEFVAYWRRAQVRFSGNQGAGLAVVSEPFASPTLARLKAAFLQKFPLAKWLAYDSVSDESIYEGIKVATGRYLQAVYAYDKAEIVVSLDSDFLFGESDNIAAARGYAQSRRVASEHDAPSRLYVAEGVFSVTGTMADHRLRLASSRITFLAIALAIELQNQGLQIPLAGRLTLAKAGDFDQKWLKVAAADLVKAKGKSLIVAGRRQPAVVHALVLAMNEALGNVNTTVTYCDATDTEISSRMALAELCKDMNAGKIDTLVIAGGNPAYNAPSDIDFAGAMAKVPNRVNLSMHVDETARLMNWHLPQAHFLEAWGDARATDGTQSVIQPLILPLFGGHSSTELLALLVDGLDSRGYDIVRGTWNKIITGSFEPGWERVLFAGMLDKSGMPTVTPAVNSEAVTRLCSSEHARAAFDDSGTFEVAFRPSAAVYDGRYANNGWLQETPDPLTMITWDNVALISPKAAAELAINNGDVIKITQNGRAIEIPAWIMPGQSDRTVTLDLGYGRKMPGRYGDGVGTDVSPLRALAGFDFSSGASITPTGRSYVVASTQDHGTMDGRPLVREATLEEYRRQPKFAQEAVEFPPLKSLWKEHDYSSGYQWGLTVDLNTCIGCGACAVACQSENNIVVVGKKQIGKGRKMNWLRVDRYFAGEPNNPEVVHQVVMCQHCENAPCEQVCPVAATLHDREGLNVQVYNRCIGTRYCANNCPYKVRRFNFYNYTKDTPEIVRMAMNPDVTVRSRGVMEKCTFCIQRIAQGKNKARLEDREVRDGEILTACQQACPTQAIMFGNINDPESEVSRMKRQNRNYGLLEELNTKPRLSYLARIRNPNPELE